MTVVEIEIDRWMDGKEGPRRGRRMGQPPPAPLGTDAFPALLIECAALFWPD